MIVNELIRAIGMHLALKSRRRDRCKRRAFEVGGDAAGDGMELTERHSASEVIKVLADIVLRNGGWTAFLGILDNVPKESGEDGDIALFLYLKEALGLSELECAALNLASVGASGAPGVLFTAGAAGGVFELGVTHAVSMQEIVWPIVQRSAVPEELKDLSLLVSMSIIAALMAFADPAINISLFMCNKAHPLTHFCPSPARAPRPPPSRLAPPHVAQPRPAPPRPASPRLAPLAPPAPGRNAPPNACVICGARSSMQSA